MKGNGFGPFAAVKAHEVLLKDRARTLAYQRAIERAVKPHHVVLDLGCGSGIFSFMAARAGCKKVYAVDNSPILEAAKETARRNNLLGKIEFVKADIFHFKPPEKVDVLIHEHFGYFLWDEGVTEKLLYARRHLLKKGAVLIPRQVDLYLAPTERKSELEKSFAFWESGEKYGFDFSLLASRWLKEAVLKFFQPELISLKNKGTFLAREKKVHTVDFKKDSVLPRKMEASFRIERSGRFTGLCAFFDVHLDENNSFSTGPARSPTHWGQMFFPCFSGEILHRGSLLEAALFPDRNPKKWAYRFDVN